MEQAFNGDHYLRDEVSFLVERFNIDLIVETGTYHGQTTKFLSTLAPVITTEINEGYLSLAREYLKGIDNITMLQGNSPDLLAEVLPKHKNKKILFFLDSHWDPNNVPLLPELKAIREAGIEPIIMIHDFKVEGKDFGYDTYNGQDYEYKWVRNNIRDIYKGEATIYYNSEAAGARRGCLFAIPYKWPQLLTHERLNVYSQHGEDGVIEDIFRYINTTNKYCVEFGGGDGYSLSNTRNLIKNKGWTGLMMDGNPRGEGVNKEWITAENINKILDKHNVPDKIDLLSIDVDGNDLHIWRAIKRSARAVVIEYNPGFGPDESKTIRYNPSHTFNQTSYYGASLLALKRVGEEKGMKLVYYNGLNAFFVDKINLPLDYDLPLDYVAAPGWPQDKLNREWVLV